MFANVVVTVYSLAWGNCRDLFSWKVLTESRILFHEVTELQCISFYSHVYFRVVTCLLFHGRISNHIIPPGNFASLQCNLQTFYSMEKTLSSLIDQGVHNSKGVSIYGSSCFIL